MLATLVLASSLALAYAPQDATALEGQYLGKTVQLRTPALGARLRYSATGDLLQGNRGPWSLGSHLTITKIKVDAAKIEVHGERLFLFADGREGGFQDFFTLFNNAELRNRLWPNLLKKSAYDWLFDRRDVDIEVATDPSGGSAAMGAVFEPEDRQLPRSQQGLPTGVTNAPQAAPASTEASKPRKVGGGVSAPRVLHAPDPDYNEYARKARFQGMVLLWIVVGKQGTVEQMKVARALGMGLDEEALKAVSRWRFQPATRDGEPVAVQVNVEVNFRLY